MQYNTLTISPQWGFLESTDTIIFKFKNLQLLSFKILKNYNY